MRYAIEVGQSHQAQALAKEYNFNFNAVVPAIEDFTKLPRLANFIAIELPRILPGRDRDSIEREIE